MTPAFIPIGPEDFAPVPIPRKRLRRHIRPCGCEDETRIIPATDGLGGYYEIAHVIAPCSSHGELAKTEEG